MPFVSSKIRLFLSKSRWSTLYSTIFLRNTSTSSSRFKKALYLSSIPLESTYPAKSPLSRVLLHSDTPNSISLAKANLPKVLIQLGFPLPAFKNFKCFSFFSDNFNISKLISNAPSFSNFLSKLFVIIFNSPFLLTA